MNPAIFVIIVIRLFAYFAKRNAAANGRPAPAWTRAFGRIGVMRPWIWGVVLRTGLMVLAFVLAIDGHSLVLASVCALLAAPGLVLRFALLPAGIPYLAYYFTRATLPQSTVGETRGGAVFNELRARLGWGFRLERAETARLAKGLIDFGETPSDSSVRAASLSARAVLDALEGDDEHARELFAVVQNMAKGQTSRGVRCYSQAWLLCDAARRGAYHEVVRATRRGPRTARRFFMRLAARRLLGLAPAVSPLILGFSWLVAPARRHSLWLLKRALTAPIRDEIKVQGAGLAAARRATIELLRAPRGTLTRREIRAVAHAWQNVFDANEVSAELVRRRERLQAGFDADRLAARFEQRIVRLFAALWRDSLADGETDDTEPELVLAAKDELQSELLGELETLCQALPRGETPATDDLAQHWRTWARVRALTRAFFDVLPDREYLVFQSVGVELLNHGAWLFNREKAKILGHDVFCFLRALVPKDDQNYELIVRNVKVSS